MNVKSIEINAGSPTDLALIDSHDGVWVVKRFVAWDLASWLWWLLTPADRRAVVTLTLGSGVKQKKCRAIRVADRFVRARGLA